LSPGIILGFFVERRKNEKQPSIIDTD